MRSASNPPTAELRANLERVRERIAAACARVGRDPSTARLVAVSKTWPADVVRAALDAGQVLFGENRVQEALAKIPEVGGGAWHLIGHLQRNKARHAVGAFDLIHGVDNDRLAAELDRRAAAAGTRQAVLLQVRLGGESTKFGVDPETLPALTDAVATCAHLDLRGLMTIPPPVDTLDEARPWYALLRKLRDTEAARTELPLPELSMGMTDDFEVAVEEGATLVRVGRAIFGPRRVRS